MVVQMGVYLRNGASELVNIKKTTDQGRLVHNNRMREKERERKGEMSIGEQKNMYMLNISNHT